MFFFFLSFFLFFFCDLCISKFHLIYISYTQDFIYAQILTHSYTLIVVYSHNITLKTLYAPSPPKKTNLKKFLTHLFQLYYSREWDFAEEKSRIHLSFFLLFFFF